MPHQDLPAQHWELPPANPQTRPDTIDVWRLARPCELDEDPTGWQAHVHQWLQAILAAYTGVDAEALTILRTDAGKPFIGDPDAAVPFNLSHCRDLAVLAVGEQYDVGIDVETDRRLADPLRLARRAFDPIDVARLEAAPDLERTWLMLRLWTCFEARQKTLGRGIFAERVPRDALQCCSFPITERHWASLCSMQSSPLGLRFFDGWPLRS
jgi:hypothetical protein